MSSVNNMSPNLPETTLPGMPEACLYSGARFKGVKVWAQAKSVFEIQFLNVDRDNELLYGLMTRRGKAGELPNKITYFEGEIISKKHSFLTRKWHADADTDEKFWKRFDFVPQIVNGTGIVNFCESVNCEKFKFGCLKANDQLFMRWKQTKSLENVGYVAPGFYYVCLTKSEGIIEGVYYEKGVDWNGETFSVKHIPEKSYPVYQFR